MSNAGTFTPAPDNLGGKNMGSEFPPRLDYNNVTTNVDTGRSIDLRISNLTSYNGRRSATPASGRFGAINMKRDPSMNATLSLDFSFVDSETKEPVELSKFSIFFVDIDSNSAGDHECVGSRDYERLMLADNTVLEQGALTTEEEAEQVTCKTPKAAAWIVTNIASSKRLGCLHVIGRCYRIPGVHYKAWNEVAEGEDNTAFSTACRQCFPLGYLVFGDAHLETVEASVDKGMVTEAPEEGHSSSEA